MKKRAKKLFLLTFLAGSIISANAGQTVENYKETFNDQGYTFVLPAGWNRIIDKFEGETVSYRVFSASSAYEGKSIGCETQNLEDYYSGDSQDVYDLLVPPAVSGEITMKIRRSNSYNKTAGIKVYTVVKDGDVYTRGEEIDLGEFALPSDLSWGDFSLSLPASEFKLIGLRLDGVVIDDFAASQAEIPDIRAMKLTGFSAVEKRAVADSEGNVTLSATVNIENTGNVSLMPGEDNYSITVKSYSTELCTVPVTEALAAGDAMDFVFDIPYTLSNPQANQTLSVSLKENVSGTSSSSVSYDLIAYVPIFKAREGNYEVNNDLGLIESGTVRTVSFSNIGGAPVVVEGMTLPEGVTSDAVFPMTLLSGESNEVALTFSGLNGVFDIVIPIESNGKADVSSQQMRYYGAMPPEGVYVERFESSKLPDGWENYPDSKWNISTISGNKVLCHSASSPVQSVMSPRLDFTEPSEICFQACKYALGGMLKIAYSPDRIHWTEVLSVGADGDEKQFPSTTRTFSYFSAPVPAGQWYISFTGCNVAVDNMFGGVLSPADNDIFVTSADLPTSGMVNYPVSAKINILNRGSDIVDAGAYVIRLMLGDDEVASFTGDSDLDDLATQPTSFAISFTPHDVVDSQLRAVVEIPESDYSVSTLPVDIAISGETLIAEKTVGEPHYDSAHFNGTTIIVTNYKNSIGETVIDKDVVGLAPGTVINRVRIPYTYSASKVLKPNIKMWLQNTQDAETGSQFTDTIAMTQVAVLDVEFEKTGTYQQPSYLDFEFAQPFVYTGDNLRVTMRSECGVFASSSLMSNSGKCLVSKSDTYSSYKNSPSATYYVPVFIFGLDVAAPQVEGSVLRGDAPAAGAVVRFESDDVLYTAVTGDDGSFSFPLYQSSREYQVTAMMSGALDSEPVMWTLDASKDPLNLVMLPNAVRGETIDAISSGEEGVIMTWEPLTELGSLDQGVYYEMYLDGVKVDTVDGIARNAASYTFADVSEGAHTVGVRAVFMPADTPTELAEIDVDHVLSGIAGVSDSVGDVSVTASAGEVTVRAPEGSSVMIHDINGRRIAEGSVLKEGSRFKASGIVVVSVVTADGKVSVKVRVD